MNGLAPTLAPLLVAGPLAAAAIVAALHRFVPRGVLDTIAVATAMAAAVGAAALTMAAAEAGVPLPAWMGGWQPRGGTAIGIVLAPDALGAGFVTLIAVLVGAALLVSRAYFQTLGGLFQALLLVFLGAATGFCITGDLFNFYVFFELIGVTGFVLTAYRMGGGALHGAFAFAVTNSVGGLLLLTGIGVLYAEVGTVNLAELSRVVPSLGDAAPVRLAFVLILTGLLVKAACVPFQFWLADAYAAAAAPVCVLFGGASATLGVFGIARLSWTIFGGGEDGVPPALLGTLLLPLGLATASAGAALALVEGNLKRLLALTTVSHVGVLLVALALKSGPGVAGAAAYLLGHALVKAALFVGAAVLALRFGSTDTGVLRGRGRGMPVTALLFAVGGLLLAGLPVGAIHGGKEMIVAATADHGLSWTGPWLLAASAVSGAAVLRGAGEIWLTSSGGGAAPAPPHRRATMAMVAVGLALLGADLATSAFGLDMALRIAAEGFVQPLRYAAAVLDGASLPAPVPAGNSHDGGMLEKLAPPAAAVMLASLLIWRMALPRLVSVLMDPPLRAMDRLRSLHTGDIGDYVAWLVAGLCGIGIVSAIAPWR